MRLNSSLKSHFSLYFNLSQQNQASSFVEAHKVKGVLMRLLSGRMGCWTPPGLLGGRSMMRESEEEKFSCLLDLVLQAAAYAAVDYADPT